jgi:multicomponent Na+:H+ antiporter subunit E
MTILARVKHAVPFTVVLFVLWIVLSGKFDAFHLLLGAGSALGISLGTRRLLLLPPALGPQAVSPWGAIPWLRLGVYLPWLLGQIVISSLQVAYVVLHPKMPIQPRCIRFHTPLPHTLAQLTLATSITLTPGTITLDVQDDVFVVHALTEAAARSLDPPTGNGAMQRWVAALYTAPAPPPPPGRTA